MTVKEIIKWVLQANDYDGLVHDLGECGCEINDLVTCDEPFAECEPALKVECRCGGGCKWHMMTKDAIKIDVVGNLLGFVGIDIKWRDW